MKPLLSILILLTGLGFASMPKLNANSVRLAATVPFSFAAYGTTMPAGEYVVKEAQSQTQPIQMWNQSSRKTIFLPFKSVSQNFAANAADSPKNADKLVFARFQDHLYLTQVCTGGAGCNAIAIPRLVREAVARESNDRAAVITIPLRPRA